MDAVAGVEKHGIGEDRLWRRQVEDLRRGSTGQPVEGAGVEVLDEMGSGVRAVADDGHDHFRGLVALRVGVGHRQLQLQLGELAVSR